MTVRKIYVCSQCGIERMRANHWFVFIRNANGLAFQSWESAEFEDRLDDDHLGHLCGQACAHKLLDSFLANLEKQEV